MNTLDKIFYSAVNRFLNEMQKAGADLSNDIYLKTPVLLAADILQRCVVDSLTVNLTEPVKLARQIIAVGNLNNDNIASPLYIRTPTLMVITDYWSDFLYSAIVKNLLPDSDKIPLGFRDFPLEGLSRPITLDSASTVIINLLMRQKIAFLKCGNEENHREVLKAEIAVGCALTNLSINLEMSEIAIAQERLKQERRKLHRTRKPPAQIVVVNPKPIKIVDATESQPFGEWSRKAQQRFLERLFNRG